MINQSHESITHGFNKSLARISFDLTTLVFAFIQALNDCVPGLVAFTYPSLNYSLCLLAWN